MNLLKIEIGILILKPELPKDRIGEFKSTLYPLVGEVGSKVLAEFTVKLTIEKARKLWSKDVSIYPWAEEFYHHLSSREVTLLLLEGNLSAKSVKRKFREIFTGLINKLNTEQNRGFSLDLIHGSDEGEGLKELSIISGSEVGILTIDFLLKKKSIK